MPEETEPKTEKTIRYKVQQYSDTEGRTIVKLSPLAPDEPMRFEGSRTIPLTDSTGKIVGSLPCVFELIAVDADEAFDGFDDALEQDAQKRVAEINRKRAARANKIQLPNVRQVLGFQRGGNGKRIIP